MSSIPFHPLSNMFPLMQGEESDALVEDIRKNGQREPIVLYQGKVLDGRNRHNACLAAEVGLKISKHEDDCPYIGDPAAYVISKNIHRRHLTAEQKRDLIAKLLKAEPKKSDRQIADTVKASPTTVGTVRREMEEKGEVSKLDTRTDARGVEQPANKGWSPERRKQHKAKRGALRAERDAKLAQRLKREDYYETTEAEADSFATKLIARSRNLAVDLHGLLSVGAELQLMDALSRRLESNDVDPEAAAEKRKAEMAKLEEPANENKIAAEIEGVVNAALSPKRRGRPKGSKNKPKAQAEAT